MLYLVLVRGPETQLQCVRRESSLCVSQRHKQGKPSDDFYLYNFYYIQVPVKCCVEPNVCPKEAKDKAITYSVPGLEKSLYSIRIFEPKRSRDCLARWIWLLMTCMASSRPK
jgi:hypothetical protein